jgi:protein-disulfide isomerase
MAKQQRVEKGRGKRPGVVTTAKRGGPPKGFWVALGVVAVLGIGALGYLTSRPKDSVKTVDPTLPKVKSEGYVMGNPSAPVEVIEYADFECPGCGQFATLTEPDVRARLINTGKVRVRYIDYPLPMHKNTWDASLAAACADDQGKFWQMHDAIFANQDRWNGEATSRPRPVLEEIAKSIGLDMPKYSSCMEADTHRAKIQAHLALAEKQQVSQTPTFVIGGKMIPGAISYDSYKKYVEEAAASGPKAGAKPDSGASTTADARPQPAGRP